MLNPGHPLRQLKGKGVFKKKKNREPLHSFKVPGMERRMTDMKDALWKWSKLYFF
jgi:hypothetical protein